jgi:hypothetical protein
MEAGDGRAWKVADQGVDGPGPTRPGVSPDITPWHLLGSATAPDIGVLVVVGGASIIGLPRLNGPGY